MRRSGINRGFPFFLCVLVVGTLAAEAAGMRQIQRLYRRKEYAEARRMLIRELPDYTGKSRRRAVLLLAALETDTGRAMDLYRQVISSGDSREGLRARLEIAKIHYARGEYRSAITAISRIPGRGSTEDRMAAFYFRALCWKQLGDAGKPAGRNR